VSALSAALKALAYPTFHLFILADTSYSACCVDEVAAQHAAADLVVHYGQACLSPTSRLPVRYCFGRAPIDVQHCATTIRSTTHLCTSRTALTSYVGVD
jgi:diphthamide biosynthesis protein 2